MILQSEEMWQAAKALIDEGSVSDDTRAIVLAVGALRLSTIVAGHQVVGASVDAANRITAEIRAKPTRL